MTPTQAKAQRKQLMKEIGNELRAKDKISLHQLRARIHEAQAARREAIAGARHQCKAAHVALRARQKAEREKLKYDQAADRLARRGSCASSKSEASERGKGNIMHARHELSALRREQVVIERAGKAPRLRSTSGERRQESDDHVRSNLPSDLVPVFNKVRGRIKATARKSRTEAFFEWAHENPDEIVLVQQAEADRDLKRLLAEEKQQERVMRKAGRYTNLSKAEVEKRLAGVPF